MIDNEQYILVLLKEKLENPYNRQLAVKFTQEGVNYFLEINKKNKHQHFLCCPKYIKIVVELFPALVVEEENFIVFRNILKNHLLICFDCVEAFHINAKKLYQRHKSIYITDFENNNIDTFFENLGKWQINRIIAALNNIEEKIKTDDSNEINLPVFFELLLNFKCLQNNKINELLIIVLSTLKQQGKFVKLTSRCMPGLLLCALHENQEVRKWAWISFQTINHEIGAKEFEEFEFDIIIDNILKKLVRFDEKQDFKYPFTKDIVEFWKGFRRILSRLENKILCSQYSIKPIIYTYWKKCNRNQESLLAELLKALNMLLEKLKEDFWTNCEQWKVKILDIFESSSFQYLTRVHSKKMFLLTWIKSYMISAFSSNNFINILEKVLDILVKESQKSDCDNGYRILCYDTILEIIIQTLSINNNYIYYQFYLDYSSKSSKFKTIFDNIMRNFSHEDIKRNMQSLGMSEMKSELLNKLKEDQKKRSAKYLKRQVRVIEAPSNKEKNQWMVRFQKQKDDEARLMPNVSLFYKKILSLNYTASSELPPKSCLSNYKSIPNTFLSVEHYVQIFEPFLILECWQNLVNSKEKANNEDQMDIFIENVCMIDDFIEVSFNCEQHNRGHFLESDLFHIQYEASEQESLQYNIQNLVIVKNNKLLLYLNDFSHDVRRFLFRDSKWKAYRIMSLTSVTREYAALISMSKFSLKNQIINPKIPITTSSSSTQRLEHYKKNFHVNYLQAEIIGKILDNDCGFSLVKGPPGTGKSEMVVGLISALREHSDVQGTCLICAPSNIIVSILVKKLKAGIFDSAGNLVRVNIVYLGLLGSITNDMRDVSLDFLAEKMMLEVRGGYVKDFSYYKRKVLEGAHIICSTLIESGHEILSTLNINFSTLIIDNVTQATELSSLIPLKYNPKRVVLIGDPNQSSPTVLSKIAKQFSYDQSLFTRIQKNCPSSINTLKIQYRMHKEISKFPNQFFYDSLIKNADYLLQKRNRPWYRNQFFSPYRFFNVERIRNEKNNSEAKIISQACKRLIKDFSQVNFEGRIGIIIPDKGQKVDFIKELTNDTFIEFEIDTLDAFQGQEKDIIILSCFCAIEEKISEFLRDSKSLNVALTRAKSSLWIFGSAKILVQNDVWKAVIEDAKDRGCYTEAFNNMFSGVDSIAEDDSLMLEENIENDNGPNNRSISLQSGLLVQFNDPIPPEEFPSLSHFRSPHVYYERRSVHQRRSFSGNHHRRYSPIKVDIRERLSFSGHRYHDKRSECDPSDECYSLGLSQSSIRGDYDNDERNLRLQISETNINNDYSEDYEHYDDEMVIERSSSPEEDSKHRKFKNEKKTQVYHDYDKDRSPQIHLEYCDGQKKLLLEKKRYTVR
ncbi:P-loop containing nucleoside triphosphate hydrolase protein [Rhizophagus irregularis]|nr:P-loop containing nucleoside triphosphate hydrolase protein [Rhizophagus irregularis]